MNTNSTIIARMTVKRHLGVDTIIEVHSDSSFQKFYHFYTQDGRKTRTRKEIRTASRNEGLPYVGAHRTIPGLEILAAQWMHMQHVQSVKVKIYKKRAYKRLITAPASELGQAIARPLFPSPALIPA